MTKKIEHNQYNLISDIVKKMGSVGKPIPIIEQMIQIIKNQDFIEVAVQIAAWEEGALLFIIDNINEIPKLMEIFENHGDNIFEKEMPGGKKLDRIIRINSPLNSNHVLSFKTIIAKGHNFRKAKIYISFSNKLFNGDIKKCIKDTLNHVIGDEVCRLVVHDSRKESNVFAVKDYIVEYFNQIPEYNIDVKIFN